jgi:pyruvate dehydrogenase E2 component (dihydrolipoyllysine-residue acetyltransferase)
VRVAVAMPNLGYDMEEGTVSRWLKTVGDFVERGDVIAEIETDKTTVEMESLASGTLVEICVEAGGAARVGEAIAWLEESAK